jgi:Zinc knuckle
MALYGGGFKGKCNKCGTIGHKALQCKKNVGGGSTTNTNSGQKDFSTYKCNYCKETGHIKTNCPKLAEKAKLKNEGSSNGPDRGEVVLTVHERYTKICKSNRCGEPGFLNQNCSDCLIGKCEMPVEGSEGFGQCPECEQLGCQGLACDCCDGTTFFEKFDTDSVHLDVMEDNEKGEYEEFVEAEEAEEMEDKEMGVDQVISHVYPSDFHLTDTSAFLFASTVVKYKETLSDMKEVYRYSHHCYKIIDFLEFVAQERYKYDEEPEKKAKLFVDTYGSNLVNLKLDSVTQLIAVLPFVNGRLVEEGFMPIDDVSMEWISALSPLWMIATVEMSHDFKLERKEIEVALVEYSYFIANKRITICGVVIPVRLAT